MDLQFEKLPVSKNFPNEEPSQNPVPDFEHTRVTMKFQNIGIELVNIYYIPGFYSGKFIKDSFLENNILEECDYYEVGMYSDVAYSKKLERFISYGAYTFDEEDHTFYCMKCPPEPHFCTFKIEHFSYSGEDGKIRHSKEGYLNRETKEYYCSNFESFIKMNSC